jgi:hypothetical protein
MDKEKGETLSKLYEGSKTPNEVINGEKQK